MASGARTVDLFAPDPDASTSGSLGVPSSEASEGQSEGEGSKESISIEWFAKKQEELRAAGLASAVAYWKARGVTWPPNP